MGQLVNIISVDVEKVNKLCTFIGVGLTSPVNIMYSTFLLWQFLGPYCLAGIAVILIMMPVTGAIAQHCRRLQEEQMKLKDSRLKQVAEVLSNMKIIKLHAWELPFIDRLRKVRSKEVMILQSFAYWTAATTVCWVSAPFLVSLFAFTAYVYGMEITVLNVSTAFVSITLLDSMRFALNIIPEVVSNMIHTAVSLRRITDFLEGEELDPKAVGSNAGAGEAVVFKGATLSWPGSGGRTLRDIHLSVRRGKLCAIVGQVGSGKSSILSSIIGELLIEEGTIGVSGSIAYVPQTTWILNCSLRQNVLLTKQLEESFYDEVLSACCLKPDIERLSSGDLTEIGERGVNLSGGQKQRVSIARAVYQDKDIYLFDDPLSALDSHVASLVFENVIGHSGLLKGKTRVLVTNNLSILPQVDFVVYVQEGRILECGSYAKMINSSNWLSMFLKQNVLPEDEERFQVNPRDTEEAFTSETQHELSKLKTSNIATREAELHDEAVETGSVKMAVYLTYLNDVGLPVVLLILFAYASSRAFDVGINLWISEWDHDTEIAEGARRPGFRLGIYAFLGLCQGVFAFIATAALANGTIRAAKRMHNRMLTAVMHAPMSFFNVTPTGRLLNRFGSDVDQLDIQLPITCDVFLRFVFQLLAAFVVVASQTPIFLAAAVPLLLLYVVIQNIYLRTQRQLKRLEAVTRSPVNNCLGETLAGLSSIRAYSVENEFMQIFSSRVDATQNCSYLLVAGRMWLTARLDIIGNIIILLVTILVLRQQHVIGDALGSMLISYVMATTVAFNYTVHYAAQMETAVVASERLVEYSNVAPEAAWKVEPGPGPDWPGQGAVEYVNFSARYSDELDLVLHNVNLSVKPSERIGVVGRTGAGKSSLMLSLFRIIEPAGGKIMIDGVDISSIGLHDLRSRLSIIPQDPVLFSGTLRFNLDPHGEHEDSELWAALECTHIKEHFLDGLETQICEGGQNISLGQRQLVCLARIVLKKAKVLVLDEATAAVDLETDRLVQETLSKVLSDCTLITIAHRLHTIMHSDRILVMADGEVIEEGSPEYLLRDQTSEFASLAKQASIMTEKL